MMFQHTICSLSDWGKLFQDKAIFEPLVEYIFREHGISYPGIDNCTPGSNAVFRAGNYIVKIFAPEESEIGGENDFITEKFGIARANQLRIAAPKLIVSGVINDKYIFRYLILEYIEGDSLADMTEKLSGAERFRIGSALRGIVDQMDIPCESFNSHVLFGKSAEDRWKVFPLKVQMERKAYLENYEEKTKVYIHGDLNPDNIIIDAKKEIYLIDFADATLAPIEMEIAGILCDGFRFDTDYVNGFMGQYDRHVLAETLLYGLLMHDYGANIIRDNIGNPKEMNSLKELRDRILEKI